VLKLVPSIYVGILFNLAAFHFKTRLAEGVFLGWGGEGAGI